MDVEEEQEEDEERDEEKDNTSDEESSSIEEVPNPQPGKALKGSEEGSGRKKVSMMSVESDPKKPYRATYPTPKLLKLNRKANYEDVTQLFCSKYRSVGIEFTDGSEPLKFSIFRVLRFLLEKNN